MGLRVAVVEDHSMIADMVKNMLMQIDEVENVQLFSDQNIEAFYRLLYEGRFNLLIADIFIGEISGLQIIEKVREKFSKEEFKILVLSSSLSHGVLKTAIQLEVNGYLSKLDRVMDFKSAILHIQANAKSFYSNRVKDELLISLESKQKELSPREMQLLHMILKAKTPKEIAYELNISINTVNYYLKKLMKKMGVNRIPDLILKAISEGYIEK